MNAMPDLTQPAGWLPVVFMALMGIAVLAYVSWTATTSASASCCAAPTTPRKTP